MFCSRATSTSVRFFKPTLEALEERTLPDATPPLSPLGALLHSYADSVLVNSSQGIKSLAADASLSIIALRQGPNPNAVASLVNDAQSLTQDANQLESQTTFFFSFVQAGFTVGILQSQDLNVLVDDISRLASRTVQVQGYVNQTTDALFAAFSGNTTAAANDISGLGLVQPIA